MIYKLMSMQSGAFKNCCRDMARDLIASGKWLDITKYKNKEHENEHKPIFIHARVETKEPEYQHDKRKGRGFSGRGDTKRKYDGKESINEEGQHVLQKRDEKALENHDMFADAPIKRKRGRPRKY